MSWTFQDAASRATALLRSLDHGTRSAGISFNAGRVLLAMMGTMDEEVGEVSIMLNMHEIAALAGLSRHQVKRAIAELTERSLITRRQDVKKPGIEAVTTLLPAAYAAVGLDAPGEGLDKLKDQSLPRELIELLCGQPFVVAERVCHAWATAEVPSHEDLGENRGGSGWIEQILRLLARRAQAAEQATQAAIDRAKRKEDALAEGRAVVETPEGDVIIDVQAFEAGCPTPVPWAFIADVLEEIRFRDPGLLNPISIPRIIAEAAYSRAYSPFCRGLDWQRGVWALGGQMARDTWGRPRKIWDDWYTVADLACLGSASSHH